MAVHFGGAGQSIFDLEIEKQMLCFFSRNWPSFTIQISTSNAYLGKMIIWS
jgi:hypothetical protein